MCNNICFYNKKNQQYILSLRREFSLEYHTVLYEKISDKIW